jgi:hypothetical protein
VNTYEKQWEARRERRKGKREATVQESVPNMVTPAKQKPRKAWTLEYRIRPGRGLDWIGTEWRRQGSSYSTEARAEQALASLLSKSRSFEYRRAYAPTEQTTVDRVCGE